MPAPSLVIGVQTAPRRVYYCPEVIANMQRAGFPGPLRLYAEPGDLSALAEYGDYLQIDQAREQRGCFQNWKYALTQLAALDADWTLLCQDDAIWRQDAYQDVLRDLERHQGNTQLGCLSFYTSIKMVEDGDRVVPADQEHWAPARFHNKAFVGAQALCFPRAGLQAFLRAKRFVEHDHWRKVDVVVGHTFRHDLQLPLLVRHPSLVQHIGKVSSIGRHKIRGIQWGRVAYGFREPA